MIFFIKIKNILQINPLLKKIFPLIFIKYIHNYFFFFLLFIYTTHPPFPRPHSGGVDALVALLIFGG